MDQLAIDTTFDEISQARELLADLHQQALAAFFETARIISESRNRSGSTEPYKHFVDEFCEDWLETAAQHQLSLLRLSAAAIVRELGWEETFSQEDS